MMRAMPKQPSGTVTLVFTDIEGSTRLLHELGQDAYRDALDVHRRVVREAFARHDGTSSVHAAFPPYARARARRASCGRRHEGPVGSQPVVHDGPRSPSNR